MSEPPNSSDDQARERIKDIHTHLQAFNQRLGLLEDEVKTLKAFHHWATTQVFPHLDGHERILARIERQLADPFLRRPKDEELQPQAMRQLSEQERIQRGIEHIQNHPPFTG